MLDTLYRLLTTAFGLYNSWPARTSAQGPWELPIPVSAATTPSVDSHGEHTSDTGLQSIIYQSPISLRRTAAAYCRVPALQAPVLRARVPPLGVWRLVPVPAPVQVQALKQAPAVRRQERHRGRPERARAERRGPQRW